MVIKVILVLTGIVILGFFLNWLDYKFMKKRYLESEKFDLNICCGNTSCEGVNADIVKRDVSKFVLVKNIYKLPFKDKQFKNTICSHTLEHIDNPKKFFDELRRVSKNVTILVPPLWDFGCMINIWEHRLQFLTFTSRHKNKLPKFFYLPFSKTFQKKLGQQIK
ncbi:MAG: methyltransferase domain-containing protein [Candidatus Woesearchaeota archaeon]|jgi:hypothetical protein